MSMSDVDRELIERHVLLPYALYYLDQDLSKAAEMPGLAIEKQIIPRIRKIAEQEQFRIRNELRKRGIKVQSEKGWYVAEGNGLYVENKMNAEMVRSKVEMLLMELIKKTE